MIEFSNVTKIYKETGTKALKGVSFKIPKGDFVFLIGETGAVKTTISRLMQREEKYDRGRIIIDEYNLSDIKKRDIPYLRRKMGVVFQDYRLLAHKNVFENVAFAMEVIGTPKRNIEHMVPQILSLVGLEEKSEARPSQLSGGEQQRVAMSRAMANNPPILIADEPTGNLDPDTSREIMYLFERFNRLGTTVIIATHAREIVDEMQKRVIELKDGIVIRDERRGGYYNV